MKRSSVGSNGWRNATILLSIAFLVLSFHGNQQHLLSVEFDINDTRRTSVEESSLATDAATVLSVKQGNTVVDDDDDERCNRLIDAFSKQYNDRPLLRRNRYDQKKYLTRKSKVYDLFEPEAVCFTDERFGSPARYDAFGDGPKFVCGVDLIAQKNKTDEGCLVYSVGSNNEIDFEVAVHNFLGCETHTFDPTLEEAFIGDEYATFHPWGIGEEGKESGHSDNRYTARSIESIMKELGHLDRTLDILKIDCEHCEYVAMPPLFEAIAAGKLKVNQIQIELHGVQFERVKRLFEAADKAKMKIFHKERNHWGCDGYRCLEYALIHEDFLREANRAAICDQEID